MKRKSKPDLKWCPDCNDFKETKEFYRNSQGYLRCRCRSCHNKKSGVNQEKRFEKNPDTKDKYNAKLRSKNSQKRQSTDPKILAQVILEDCRKTDRKRNRECDLDTDFIVKAIQSPCIYCGDTTLRVSLDRVDNTAGHTKSNVVRACIRCNYTRGAMPYLAWLQLVPGMKAARELGLFGNWTGRCHKSK